jgi:hypothetical protein
MMIALHLFSTDDGGSQSLGTLSLVLDGWTGLIWIGCLGGGLGSIVVGL